GEVEQLADTLLIFDRFAAAKTVGLDHYAEFEVVPRRGETRNPSARVRQREGFAGMQCVGEGGVTGIGIRRDVREVQTFFDFGNRADRWSKQLVSASDADDARDGGVVDEAARLRLRMAFAGVVGVAVNLAEVRDF